MLRHRYTLILQRVSNLMYYKSYNLLSLVALECDAAAAARAGAFLGRLLLLLAET